MSLKLLSIKLKINNKKFVQSFTFNLFNLYVNFYCLLIYTKSNDIDKIKNSPLLLTFKFASSPLLF